jgi:hypothetical protein
MRNQRITDDEVSALLEGRTPSGRADLESVAAVVDTLRLTSFEAPPRPSAALASRLDLERATWISEPAGGLPGNATSRVFRHETVPTRGRVRMLFSWFTGLGLASKIVIGAAGVAVATVGAGSVHVLPATVQTAFDDTVTAVVGDEQPVEDATGEVAEDTTVDTDTDETATDTTITDETTVDDTTVDSTTTEDTTTTAPEASTDASTTTEVKVNENAPAHAQAVQAAAHTKSEAGEHGKLVREAAHSNKVTADVDVDADAEVEAPAVGSVDAGVTAEATAKAKAKG